LDSDWVDAETSDSKPTKFPGFQLSYQNQAKTNLKKNELKSSREADPED
ncbi:unnamed protein product, partial [Allacma fusca]